MKELKTEIASNNEAPIKPQSIFSDLDKLRLSIGSTVFGGTTEILSKVAVRKPQKQEFVRVHPDEGMMLATAVYEDKQEREFYFVAPNMMSAMLGETTPVILVTAINRQKVSFLWPIKVANDNSSGNAWQDSAQQGCEVAKKTWVRLVADMSLGAYRIWAAQGDLSEPEWRPEPLNELLEIAFRGRVIENDDHPVVRRLRGLI
ncbi:hypothetical protein [Bradyrhizobium sp. AS23.2]|uniref:hypothetical protein n=1 Tax=Bradyrhizobium sp. AS23.2 TaxID=1680155 RepID=UPI0011610D10|nr:hypothetical protein [Bradyrhizobium sp. AS23.2]